MRGSGPTENNPRDARLDVRILIAFIFVVIIGGSNAVAVRFSNLELPPFWGAATRFAVAAIIFWVIVLVRGIALPKGRSLLGASILGLLTVGGSYAFLYWALLRVQAGFTMIVLALVPLLTLIFAVLHGLETFKWRGLVGAFIAFAGIILSISGGLGGEIPILSLLALIAAGVCLAEGTVVYKYFPKSHPVATNAVSVSIGAALLFALSFLVGERWILPTASNTWTAFLYLSLIGSVLLFYLYLFVLSNWTASATSYSFLLFPVSATLIGAWLAGEDITLMFILGGVFVMAGVYLGAIYRPRTSTTRERATIKEEPIP
jgi:drug/metabolite transporter (DMT)-like permease